MYFKFVIINSFKKTKIYNLILNHKIEYLFYLSYPNTQHNQSCKIKNSR